MYIHMNFKSRYSYVKCALNLTSTYKFISMALSK